MKVFKTILAVAVAAFMFASCEKEQYNTTLNKTEVINYSVVLDDVTGTRASELYDGSKINRLDYVVYMRNEDGITYTATEVKEIGKEFTGSQTVSIELIKGQSYKITFIAYTDTQKGNWWSTADNQVITFDHSKVSANSDSGDLFVACVDHQTTSVSLKRPLALVNLMLSQAHVETAKKLGFNPANAQITYTVSNIAQSYDLLNGTVSGTDNSDTLTNSFGDVANSYYTMSSVLVAAGQTVNCNIATVTCTGLKEIPLNKDINSIPAKANYKTNVKIGSLLTNKFDYTLTVSAGFDTPDEEKLVD